MQVGGVSSRRSVAGALYLGLQAVRRSGYARSGKSLTFLNCCHEAVPVAAERLDAVLPHPVIGYGLADHSQATRQ
jgi:hypothetical protein